jgi:transcription antitermination factor NusB
MGNRRVARETALQFLFSRELNVSPDGSDQLFALRVAKQNPFSDADRLEEPHHDVMPDAPETDTSEVNKPALQDGMGSDAIRSVITVSGLPSIVSELETILHSANSKKLKKRITKQLKLARDYSSNHSFVENLVLGVLEHQAEIDTQIADKLENFTLPRLSTIDRNVLRIAVYEMFHCDDTPPIVAINEAIELAKRFGTEDSGSFVNGMLDRLKDQLTRPLRD